MYSTHPYTLPLHAAHMYRPFVRPVYTGAFFNTHMYGPYIQVSKSAPVCMGRIYRTCECPLQFQYFLRFYSGKITSLLMQSVLKKFLWQK